MSLNKCCFSHNSFLAETLIVTSLSVSLFPTDIVILADNKGSIASLKFGVSTKNENVVKRPTKIDRSSAIILSSVMKNTTILKVQIAIFSPEFHHIERTGLKLSRNITEFLENGVDVS